jgi:hypothetical protein
VSPTISEDAMTSADKSAPRPAHRVGLRSRVAGWLAVLGATVGVSLAGGPAALAATDPLLAPAATTTVVELGSSYAYGDSIVAGVTVTAADGSPGVGTVTTTVNGTPIGTGKPLSGGTADLVIGASTSPFTDLTPGDWTVEVTFVPDDPTLFASSANTSSISVGKFILTLDVTTPPRTIRVGELLTVEVVSNSSPLPGSDANIQFYGNGVLLSSPPTRRNLTYLLYTPTEAGSLSITAVYPETDLVARVETAPVVFTVVDPNAPAPSPGAPDAEAVAAAGTGPSADPRLADTGAGGTVNLALPALAGIGLGALGIHGARRRRRS